MASRNVRLVASELYKLQTFKGLMKFGQCRISQGVPTQKSRDSSLTRLTERCTRSATVLAATRTSELPQKRQHASRMEKQHYTKICYMQFKYGS